MKRADLIRHLTKHGCRFYREGGKHTLYYNPATNQSAAVPRHKEIYGFLPQKICDELQIPHPKGS